MSKSIYTFFIFVGLSVVGFSQNKQLDKLEMFYDQGNYKKVIRKSDKLLSGDYHNHPTPTLFHALSEFQLSKSNDKYSSSNAIFGYEKFLKLDSTGRFRKMFDIYIYDMQLGIANEIRMLNNEGKEEKSRTRYNTYQRLFGSTASYEAITQNEPVIEDTTPPEDVTPEVETDLQSSVIKEAKKHLGTPYKYGGNDKNGFDCSGFSQYVMAKNGLKIPRTAQSQSDQLKKIKISQARKGDLVFFGSNKNHINHVGIVISEKGAPLTMIHASSSRGIMITQLDKDPYWEPRLKTAARIID